MWGLVVVVASIRYCSERYPLVVVFQSSLRHSKTNCYHSQSSKDGFFDNNDHHWALRSSCTMGPHFIWFHRSRIAFLISRDIFPRSSIWIYQKCSFWNWWHMKFHKRIQPHCVLTSNPPLLLLLTSASVNWLRLGRENGRPGQQWAGLVRAGYQGGLALAIFASLAVGLDST